MSEAACVLVALLGAPQEHRGEDRAPASLEALEAEWSAAQHAWARDWFTRFREDPQTRWDAPIKDFWDDYEGLYVSGRAPARAVLWQLETLRLAGFSEVERRERLLTCVQRVQRAGTAAWVAEALPLISRNRDFLEGHFALEPLLAELARAAAPGSALAREAQLALAAWNAPSDPERAFGHRLAAFDFGPVAPSEDPGESAVDAAGTDLDRVTDVVVELLQEQERAYVPPLLDPEGVRLIWPASPPSPEQRLRPVLEDLANRGSVDAALWLLDRIRPRGEWEAERLRGWLASVARSELDPDQIDVLVGAFYGLVFKVGEESVEAALVSLRGQVRTAEDARLLLQLGKGLCRRGGEANLERGRALLREVIERFGGSDAAAQAGGQLFRAERLRVGMRCPDFEAVDTDGAAFELSDYAGKVVVLDFWGFW